MKIGKFKGILLLALGVVFIILAYPPFYLSPLIFPAFLLLLLAVDGKSKIKTILQFGFVFLIFYAYHLKWLLNLELAPATKSLLYIGFVFLLLYMTSYWILIGFIYRKIYRGTLSNSLDILGFSAIITLFEVIRSKGVLGFPWSTIFESQLGNLPLAQIVSIVGPFGLTFFILSISFSLFMLKKKRIKEPLIAISFLVIIELYGFLRMKKIEAIGGGRHIKIALFQHNVAPREIETEEEWRETVEAFRELSDKLKEPVDLIITSESAMPGYYRVSLKDKELVKEILSGRDTYLILGNADYGKEHGEYVFYNTAFLIDSTGKIVSSYNKTHLVPFGEWLPYEDKISILRELELGQGNYRPGKELVIFEIEGIKLGTLICFESIFPEISRNFVRKGARILVNITSDGWYGRSLGPVEHFELARFRCIENNVPLVRCAKTGISAIISPTGRIIKKLGLFERGTLIGKVEEGSNGTIYTKIGDLPIILSLLLLSLLSLVYNLKKYGGSK